MKTGCNGGREAQPGAPVTVNGVEAISGVNVSNPGLPVGSPSNATATNPLPLKALSGAHPSTARTVPGGPVAAVDRSTAQGRLQGQRLDPCPRTAKWDSSETALQD